MLPSCGPGVYSILQFQECFLSLSIDRHKKAMQLIDPLNNSFRILFSHRSLASCYNFHNSLVSLMLFNSCVRLLPRLSVTSINLSISPSVKCFWRQFQLKVQPIRLAFVVFIVLGIFFFSTPHNTSPFFTRSVQPIFSILSSTTSQNYSGISELFRKCLSFNNVKTSVLVELLINRSVISLQYNMCTGRVDLNKVKLSQSTSLKHVGVIEL